MGSVDGGGRSAAGNRGMRGRGGGRRHRPPVARGDGRSKEGEVGAVEERREKRWISPRMRLWGALAAFCSIGCGYRWSRNSKSSFFILHKGRICGSCWRQSQEAKAKSQKYSWGVANGGRICSTVWSIYYAEGWLNCWAGGKQLTLGTRVVLNCLNRPATPCVEECAHTVKRRPRHPCATSVHLSIYFAINKLELTEAMLLTI
jgi:hypothetical protein